MKRQTIINIALILFFIFLFAVVFPQKKYRVSDDIREGDLYNAPAERENKKLNVGHQTQNPGETQEVNTEINILEESYQRAKTPDLPEIGFYTEISDIPAAFIGKKTSKQAAQFVIFLTETTASSAFAFESKKAEGTSRRTERVGVAKTEVLRSTDATKKSEQKDRRKEKQEKINADDGKEGKVQLDFSVLNKAISASSLTYFYPFNFKNIDDVSVGILSITPYADNTQIIKFRVDNDTSAYFFIANVSAEVDGKVLIFQKFFENVVSRQSKRMGIILIPAQASGTTIKFTLIESSGRTRRYEIIIQVP